MVKRWRNVSKMGPKKTGWTRGGYHRYKRRRDPDSGIELVKPQRKKVGKHFYGRDTKHEERSKFIRDVRRPIKKRR